MRDVDFSKAKALQGDIQQHQQQLALQRQAEERAGTIDPSYSPFGKPGAGAPNPPKQIHRDVDEQQQHYAETLRRQMDEKQRSKTIMSTNSDTSFDPWGKGTGSPQRDADGNFVRKSPTKQTSSSSLKIGKKADYKSFADIMSKPSPTLSNTGKQPTSFLSSSYSTLPRDDTDIFGNSPTKVHCDRNFISSRLIANDMADLSPRHRRV